MTVILSILCSASLIPVYAANEPVYESENNNTIATADTTLDDYDNFGKLSSYADCDYWKISFANEGIANFWLGNIPSGCDYDMYVYELQVGATTPILLTISINSSNTAEFLRIHVKNSTEASYYVYVYSPSQDYNSTSYYKLRVKNTPGLSAEYYAYDGSYNFDQLNTYQYAQPSYNWISSMGYTGKTILQKNQRASVIKNSMPTNDITVIASDDILARIKTYSSTGMSYLAAYMDSPLTNYEDISTYQAGALSGVSLIIYAGNYTSDSYVSDMDSSEYNLIDVALSKGAYNAIGWDLSASEDLYGEWLDYFFEALYYGCSIDVACETADDQFWNGGVYFDEDILQRYYGNSNFMESTILYNGY